MINTLVDIVYGYSDIAVVSQPLNEIISGSSTETNIDYQDLFESLNGVSQESYLLNVKAQGLISSIDSLDLYKKSTFEDYLFLFTIVLESIEYLSLTS